LGDEDRQEPREEKPLWRWHGLAVIMHRIWVDGTKFRWTREAAAV
jgi:hypothetical protein